MAHEVERNRVGFWILIGVLAVSGIAMAFIAIFGMFDSIAYSLVWRVFVADVYLIAALAAQHTWLRWAAWIGTGITFLIGVVNVFWQFTPENRWNGEYVYGDTSTGWSPWWGFEFDVEIAAHMALGTILLLGLISLAYRWIAGERVLRAIYVFTFVTGVLSMLLGVVLVLDSPYRWNVGSWLEQLAAGIVILALTGAAIVIIGAFVQRKAARAQDAKAQTAPLVANAGSLLQGGRYAPPAQSASLENTSPEELRALVRQYVDEYLRARGE